MSATLDPKAVSVSDAMAHLLETLRKGTGAHYGYDLSVDQVVYEIVEKSLPHEARHEGLRILTRTYYDAAWEICVRGIIRPGIKAYQDQAVPAGGYSLTAFGKKWLSEPPTDPIIVSDPSRLAAHFDQVHARMGNGFYQRATEAVRCYQAHAFLGTCVMCGAAAESIVLALAIAKDGDEVKVLKTYASSQGRSRVENILLGQTDAPTKATFAGFLGLLKDWRDESAHGHATPISADEAATALDLLARFGLYADREWERLTT